MTRWGVREKKFKKIKKLKVNRGGREKSSNIIKWDQGSFLPFETPT
jgi:hypothetical protein